MSTPTYSNRQQAKLARPATAHTAHERAGTGRGAAACSQNGDRLHDCPRPGSPASQPGAGAIDQSMPCQGTHASQTSLSQLDTWASCSDALFSVPRGPTVCLHPSLAPAEAHPSGATRRRYERAPQPVAAAPHSSQLGVHTSSAGSAIGLWLVPSVA